MVWLFDHTAKFPRHERFRLAKVIEESLFQFHENLLRAAQSEHARDHLQEANLHLNRLRAYLRIALELKYTSPRQYQFAAKHTAELGKLLGGWLKTA